MKWHDLKDAPTVEEAVLLLVLWNGDFNYTVGFLTEDNLFRSPMGGEIIEQVLGWAEIEEPEHLTKILVDRVLTETEGKSND